MFLRSSVVTCGQKVILCFSVCLFVCFFNNSWLLWMVKFYITVFIVIEKLVKSRSRCGFSPGLCQTNMFYYVWRKSFVSQSTSAALRHFIKTLFCDTFYLHETIVVLVIWILHLNLYYLAINCAALRITLHHCQVGISQIFIGFIIYQHCLKGGRYLGLHAV